MNYRMDTLFARFLEFQLEKIEEHDYVHDRLGSLKRGFLHLNILQILVECSVLNVLQHISIKNAIDNAVIN